MAAAAAPHRGGGAIGRDQCHGDARQITFCGPLEAASADGWALRSVPSTGCSGAAADRPVGSLDCTTTSGHAGERVRAESGGGGRRPSSSSRPAPPALPHMTCAGNESHRRCLPVQLAQQLLPPAAAARTRTACVRPLLPLLPSTLIRCCLDACRCCCTMARTHRTA